MKRLYPCVCHVCGRSFDHQAQFMSTARSRVGADGVVRSVVTCNVNDPSAHSSEQIRSSWLAEQR